MKRKIALSLLFFVTVLTMTAGPVTKEQAQTKAREFLAGRVSAAKGAFAGSQAAAGPLTTAAEDQSYYVFNVGNGGGYLVMSGSDKTQSVLGYSDNGRFDNANMSEGFKEWLAELSAGIKAVENGTSKLTLPAGRAKGAATRSVTKNVIPVLVPSQWNQGGPYNNYCPTYTRTLDDNGNTLATPETGTCATGCVATAMAQVMYYWKWPVAATTTIDSYTYKYEKKSHTLAELPAITFAWDKMTDTYGSSSTAESQDAVARLMQYVGQAVQMGYGPSSGAGVDKPSYAFKKYFGYDSNVHFEAHDNYSYQEWEDLIYTELAAGRPMMMNASTSNGGAHEFVCDGYDGNGYYHINWGWGGLDDGYFLLTVMAPDEQGIGGSDSSDGYSMGQGLVVGIQPPTGEPERETIIRNSVTSFTLNGGNAEYKSTRKTNGKFYVYFKYKTGTGLSEVTSFDNIFATYDEAGNQLSIADISPKTFSITPGYWGPDQSMSAFWGGDLPDGKYFLKILSREHGTEEWNKAENADKQCVMAEIDGDNLTLRACPYLNLLIENLEIIGNGNVNTEQKVKATITNNGTTYYDELYLMDGTTWVSGNCVNLPAGETTEIFFTYKPTTAGAHKLGLSKSKNSSDTFYTKDVTIYSDKKTTLSLSISSKVSPTTVSGTSCLFGDEATFIVRVRNTGENDYVSFIEVSPWKAIPGYYVKSGSVRQDISLAPGETTTIELTVPNLEYNSRYSFHADTDNSGSATCGDFTMKEGYKYWTADGVLHTMPWTTGSRLGVTSDMVAIKIPGEGSATGSPAFTEGNVNENLIVFFEAGATISSRIMNIYKKYTNNFVFGDNAENITLNMNSGIFIPQRFTAESITATLTAPESNAYSTLVLPFVPGQITSGDETIDWFHNSSETGKQIAISEFSEIEGTDLYFTCADKLVENRPYLITYAGKMNESVFNQMGKTLTLSGENIEVKSSPAISTYSTNYKFVGTTGSNTVTDAYILSTDGRSFVKQPSADVNPLSAFFVANTTAAAEADKLNIITEGITTAISSITADGNGNAVVTIYGINGAVVGKTAADKLAQTLTTLPKGVYVINGKKYIVK